MTPELKSLCDRLQVLSGYLAAADEEEAFPIVDEAAAKLREMAGALSGLFDPIENDVSYNLQGVLHDLRGPYDPNDGGVCARTIERVIAQLERARAALGGSHG